MHAFLFLMNIYNYNPYIIRTQFKIFDFIIINITLNIIINIIGMTTISYINKNLVITML